MSLKEPAVFDFGDWREFCRDVARYHKIVRPKDELLSDRIETCCEFMSPRAKQYLEGFVRPHPRYRIAKGWKKWVSAVESKLELFPKLLDASKVLGKYGLYRAVFYIKKRVAIRDVWMHLDKRVCEGAISDVEQRREFWSSLNSEQQSTINQLSGAFDVQNDVWLKDDPEVRQMVQQNLHQIMELFVVDQVFDYLAISRAFLLLLTSLAHIPIGLLDAILLITFGVSFGGFMTIFLGLYLPIMVYAVVRYYQLQKSMQILQPHLQIHKPLEP